MPLPVERATCAHWLRRELDLILPTTNAVLALGQIAWTAALQTLRGAGFDVPRPLPKFGHGAEAQLGRLRLFGSYHVSQQNTFTGVLTEPMLDGIFAQARALSQV